MFDQIARVSEYIKPQPGGRDHYVRVDNLAFEVRARESVRTWVCFSCWQDLLPEERCRWAMLLGVKCAQ